LGEIVRDIGRVFGRENGSSAAEDLIAGNSPRIPNLRAPNFPFALSLNSSRFVRILRLRTGFMGASERCVVAVGEGGGPPMKGKISSSNPESLTREIAALAGVSRADLTSRWRVLYDTEAPRRISRELLRRAIAYRLQEL